MNEIHFQFERRQIEQGEYQILLDVFDADEMTPHGLSQSCGTVKIRIAGYEHERPARVPELRIFLRALGKSWRPGTAAFFCDLRSAFFTLYITSQLNNVIVVENPTRFCVWCRPNELEPIFLEAHSGIAELGERAGLTKKVIRRRQKQFIQELSTVFKF